MNESKIEKYLVDRVKALGGKAIKMIPTYENGIPDRQVLLGGKTFFVELKKEGQNPDPLQVAYMKELERMGFNTFVLDSINAVDSFMSEIEQGHCSHKMCWDVEGPIECGKDAAQI